MLFAVGVVTYVARAYRVGTDDPAITKVSSVHDPRSKPRTNATLQSFYHLFSALYLRFAVEPSNSLQLLVEILSPFSIDCYTNFSLFFGVCSEDEELARFIALANLTRNGLKQ